MCFVACQKQSVPAHYIYSTSCSRRCGALIALRQGRCAPKKSDVLSSATVKVRKHVNDVRIRQDANVAHSFLSELHRISFQPSPNPPPRHKIKVNKLFRVPCAAPHPSLVLCPGPPVSPCSVWALEVVSRGLCPVHWS